MTVTDASWRVSGTGPEEAVVPQPVMLHSAPDLSSSVGRQAVPIPMVSTSNPVRKWSVSGNLTQQCILVLTRILWKLIYLNIHTDVSYRYTTAYIDGKSHQKPWPLFKTKKQKQPCYHRARYNQWWAWENLTLSMQNHHQTLPSGCKLGCWRCVSPAVSQPLGLNSFSNHLQKGRSFQSCRDPWHHKTKTQSTNARRQIFQGPLLIKNYPNFQIWSPISHLRLFEASWVDKCLLLLLHSGLLSTPIEV